MLPWALVVLAIVVLLAYDAATHKERVEARRAIRERDHYRACCSVIADGGLSKLLAAGRYGEARLAVSALEDDLRQGPPPPEVAWPYGFPPFVP